ncbi:GNAT family N-acetyltransferase [Streptomyces physcomitrii]|uniref:GNAT family N-acetyltransferase n=1 Tax=Streptomyces physcomitrii TaxID=2724184 RepID=UPI0033DCADD8
MSIDLRVLREADFDSWYALLDRAFGGVPEPAEERALWKGLIEYERSLAAWDEKEIVGSAGAFSFRMTVPGGARVPTAGVTMVSVAATHRRRGVLRSMMRRQLDDIRALGEPLAALVASEPDIYGRFGYGSAGRALAAEIDTARVRLRMPPGADEPRLSFADPRTSLTRCEDLYSRLVGGRPGLLARAPGWEELGLLDPESERGGASPLQCVLAEREGELAGYARYSVKPEWDAAGPKGVVRLRSLEALDPAAHAALWRFLFDLDLTSTLSVHSRPLDDPLTHLVSDPRRCGLRTRDVLYLRIVDLPAALAARTYQVPLDTVLEVEDAFCPWNTGRWRLRGDSGGAVCERTEDEPRLALTARELGAAYLGEGPLTALAAAGLVRELVPGSLAPVSLAFGSQTAPWLPHGF